MKGELEIIAVIDFVSKLLLTEDYDLKPSPLHTNLSISCDLHCLIRADSSRRPKGKGLQKQPSHIQVQFYIVLSLKP